mgnify:CR=1 FL=1
MATDPARARWFAIVAVRIGCTLAAVLGIVLLARGEETGQKLLGAAIVVVALWSMAIFPRALARRWRSPRP